MQDEMSEALQNVISDCAFSGGPYVEKFESAFSDFCHTRHAIGLNSGTTALWAALKGLGVGSGDEVITVANSFIATAEAISMCGAVPVFVDVDPNTYTMDPGKVERAISKKTRAIIPVHLFGQMADMDPIMRIAKNHNILVVEDACQAHGATYRDKSAGSIGDAGCFSFYPGKNLGAYGEGGAVTTNNSELAEWLISFRNHGQVGKNKHSMIGTNARMDGIQAAFLDVKLKYLNTWNEQRRSIARDYHALLSEVPHIQLPTEAEYGRHVYHVYAIRHENPEGVRECLAAHGISTGIHYPVPIYLQDAYRFLNLREGSYPETERIAKSLLSLPIYPEMTKEQVRKVSDVVLHYCGQLA